MSTGWGMPGERSRVSGHSDNTGHTRDIYWPNSKPVKGKIPKPPDVIQARKEEKRD